MKEKEPKHLRVFNEKHRASDEQVEAWALGYVGKLFGKDDDEQLNGVLIVTNDRVVFYRKGFTGETLKTLPRASINGFEQKSTLGMTTLSINASGTSLEFKCADKNRIGTVANALNGSPTSTLAGKDHENAQHGEQAKVGASRLGVILASAVVLAVFVFRCSGESSEDDSQTKVVAAKHERSEPAMNDTKKNDDVKSAGSSECMIGITGNSTDLPGYKTKAKFDESYKLAQAGATDIEMTRHLVSDGGKMIPAGTKCSYSDVGMASTSVIIKEGSFRLQEFIFPTEWTSYDVFPTEWTSYDD